jgi:MoaA/NifB/PqqE/SkfB family radical SAM enzyme
MDFTLTEYKKLFYSIGKSPVWTTFSGGEPFLRRDISAIIISFYQICRPKVINIPTNGILTDKIVRNVKSICEKCPKAQIIINISIDAIGEQHDKIRNVPDNYYNALITFKKLKQLNFKNLSVGIHTVISKFNVDNFANIAQSLIALQPDQYITEIAEERYELQNVGLHITPKLINYKAAVDFLIHRIKHTHIKKLMNKITQSFRLEYYDMVKKVLRDQTQIIPCFAGIASVQISPDGDVWACCIKAKPLGNLRKNKYNFRKIWQGKAFKNARKEIKNKSCFCPLANVAYTNMLLHYRTLFRVFCRGLKL